mgnify:FL=1
MDSFSGNGRWIGGFLFFQPFQELIAFLQLKRLFQMGFCNMVPFSLFFGHILYVQL